MPTLLEKAKQSRKIKKPDKVTPEEEELVFAWLDGTINRSEASAALGKSPSMSIYKLTQLIRSMYAEGKLVKGKEVSAR